MSLSDIVGHTIQLTALRTLIESGKLPNSTLLAGPAGIGKSLIARNVGFTLFCEKDQFGGCQNCQQCLLAKSGNHPDFILMDCKDKEASNTLSIRKLLSSLSLKSFSSSKRLVVLSDIENLQIQGQNVLLKTLEEPRPNTYFILTTSNVAKLLPTIVSRCQTWHFGELAPSDIAKIIEQKELDLGVLSKQELGLIADGSCENIDQLVSHAELWVSIKAVLEKIIGGDLQSALELTQTLGKDKDEIRIAISLMRIYSRHRMHSEKDPSLQHRWATCILNLLSAEKMIFESNLNAGLVLTNVFLSLAGISVTKDELIHSAVV